MNFYNSFKKIAFKFDAEMAHEWAISFLSKSPKTARHLFGNSDSDFDLSIELGNCKWRTPFGLAAGLDKNAKAIDYFSSLPFGAVEVGTVTPMPQAGNDKPRLFRYPEIESLRNRMGFNNDGLDEVLKRVKNSSRNEKNIGVNLGKNKVTSQEEAYKDYQKLYEAFADSADYLVINVSSPNTPGLRDLQKVDQLRAIFDSLKKLRLSKPCDLYLKISPDLAREDLIETANIAKEYELTGIVATNTTIIPELGAGGVSGKALERKGASVRGTLLDCLKETPDIELIGVGGISSFDDLWDFWKRGGKCVQVYSSFIYQGPQMLMNWQDELVRVIQGNSLNSFSELINNIDKVERF